MNLEDLDFFKIASIVSPFISAFLAGLITFRYTIKQKKFDLLYANKIPAFKEVVSTLINFKKFCLGRIAYFEGNEFSPYYEENLGALSHRILISETLDANTVFVSKSSRTKINELVNELSLLCNAEIVLAQGKDFPEVKDGYEKMLEKSEDCIQYLFKELNIEKY